MGDGTVDWLALLAAGGPVAARAVVVVAHPDDEALWCGALLPRLADGLLVHVTDGSPVDGGDARRLGYPTPAAYAAARARELDVGLRLLGAGVERRGYGLPDQGAMAHRAWLVDRLARDLTGADLVVTHPYEHGHPDHDACAYAVAAAVARLPAGERPAVAEFACYHADGAGGRRWGAFWPGEAAEVARPLAPAERARVAAALAAHASQAGVIAGWVPSHERWRLAPAYDFARAAAPGRALYDDWGWALTAARWRELAAGDLAVAT